MSRRGSITSRTEGNKYADDNQFLRGRSGEAPSRVLWSRLLVGSTSRCLMDQYYFKDVLLRGFFRNFAHPMWDRAN